MRDLKNNKMGGTDEIHSELIKHGGNKLLYRLYELLLVIVVVVVVLLLLWCSIYFH